MKFKKKYLFGITIGAIIFLIDAAVFLKTKYFIPLLVVAGTVAWIQPWIDFFLENQKQKEIETERG